MAAALLALAGCGRWGPPVRSSDAATAKKAAPGNNPNEPNTPAPEAPPPAPELEP
jgi:predicted small lipoprotein YifL